MNPASQPDEKRPPASGPTPKDFESAMAELEQIVRDMESGQVTLEQSLVRFERGTRLIEYCRKTLATAEQRIEVLTRSADGSVKSEPLEE